MEANPILLQRKYARIIEKFAVRAHISARKALDFFMVLLLIRMSVKGFRICIAGVMNIWWRNCGTSIIRRRMVISDLNIIILEMKNCKISLKR